MRPPSKQNAGVNALMSLHNDLDGWGTSAMKTSMETKIRSGRPYGGTGFVWTKTLSSAIRPRTEFRHDRVTVLELQSSIGSIFLINCYLPFFKANDGAAQSDKYMETIGFIDSIIDRNPDSHFVLMGDMNTNFYNGMNEFSTILKNFISERDFYCVFDSMDAFDASTCYTRSNLKQGSFTLLDYIFVSSSLTKFIVDVNIIDSGEILSDHLPIRLSLLLELSTTHSYNEFPPPVVNWRNMSMEYRQNYEQCGRL